MGYRHDEDFITSFILVPLYNRSESFREFISKKYFDGQSIDDEIEFTGAKNRRSTEYGCPDAVSKDGKLYIEVKIRKSTSLTPLEQKEGIKRKKSSNIGYCNYIKEKDNKLLYIICDGYDMTKAIPEKKGKTSYIYWSEILGFLKSYNTDDPFICIIENNVDFDDAEKVKYHQRATRLCRLSVSLCKHGFIEADKNCITYWPSDPYFNDDSIWFGYDSDFHNFDGQKLSIGISLDTGEVLIYTEVNNKTYEKRKDAKFFNKRPENVTPEDSDDNIMYLKLFNLCDYKDEDFLEKGKIITEIVKYLNKLKE